VIKYLGSKRTLVPLLSSIAQAAEARSAIDLFTGTTRVAKSFKQLGASVTAVDTASYSEVFAKTWIELDSTTANQAELLDAIEELNHVPARAGYFTKVFCEDARYFQPHNGERIDAIRDHIEANYRDSWLYHPLLTSLLLAADRVDSTTGVQMAYLKSWSRRSASNLKLTDPELLPGSGKAIRGDALEVTPLLPAADLAYLDPPYNQHRYFANYHIWETLVRWDAPERYGIANKRLDVRTPQTKSKFNSKPAMPIALAEIIRGVPAETIVLSYNNEAWLSKDELIELLGTRGHVVSIDVDFKRYIGSQIGVYNKAGERVGNPGAKRNTEHVLIAGEKTRVERILKQVKTA
jgi:adenine-specific DNA-methyltransferase